MNINTALETLDIEEKFIYDNEKEFLKRFTKKEAWLLKGVYFSKEGFRVEYILDSGRHIVDYVKTEDYVWWKENLA